MPAQLEPLRRVKCTYKDCSLSFNNEEGMKRHKKYSDEHDYCHRCDKDCVDYDALIIHKVESPEKHDKACRVCGEEYKTSSGLKRHIELSHKVLQKLKCIGCNESFYGPAFLVDHLEFNRCSVISGQEFHKHLVHKQLVSELFGNDDALARFWQKQAKFAATQDFESEGGIDLEEEVFEDKEPETIPYEVIQPEVVSSPVSTVFSEPYPPLPTSKATSVSDMESTFSRLDLNGSDTSTVRGPRSISSAMGTSRADFSLSDVSSVHGSCATGSTRPSKVWGARDGRSTSNRLFPAAKPTPVTEEFSITAYDQEFDKAHGINLLKGHRFWDPASLDYNPDRFYDAIMNKYYCPFVCEQILDNPDELHVHITRDHRITRMKCEMCHKYFRSVTALMSHCEAGNAKCAVSKAADYSTFLDRVTGGFLGVESDVRPDHAHVKPIYSRNQETGQMQKYQPTVAKYQKYIVTKPADYKEPAKTTQISGARW